MNMNWIDIVLTAAIAAAAAGALVSIVRQHRKGGGCGDCSACGKCGTCIDRKKAFEANGIKDPAVADQV